MPEFAITLARWAAWAPGLESETDWAHWDGEPPQGPSGDHNISEDKYRRYWQENLNLMGILLAIWFTVSCRLSRPAMMMRSPAVRLVGDGTLVGRYTRALTLAGRPTAPVTDGESATARGLWRIREAST